MTQITACIDASPAASAVCDAAIWVSQRLSAPMRLLHVLERPPQSQTDLSGSIGLGSREHLLKQLTELDAERGRIALENGRLMLEAAQARAQEAGLHDVVTLQRHGRLSDEVLPLCDDTRVLVMGRLGEDHAGPEANATLGSQLETVLRSVSCPVLVTTSLTFRTPERFMVAYDASDAAERALAAYVDSPLLQGAQCHLVMVKHNDAEHLAKFTAAKARLEQAGFEVVSAQLDGEVLPALMDYQAAHQIELMVMGAYGHSRIRQFFVGSHTRNMLSQSKVPLLLLR